MAEKRVFTLVDPHNGNLAFKVSWFDDNRYFDHIQRNNYYTLIWLTEGTGQVKADFSEYPFAADYLFAFAPYQPFMVAATGPVKGISLHFHPDFFCIHKHHAEVACNGVLFNNIYQSPFVQVDEPAAETLNMLADRMAAEMAQPALAHHEVLVSYLKIFLVTASRLKAAQPLQANERAGAPKESAVVQNLKEAIEKHFKTKHAPRDYAEMLNLSAGALARITKTHFNKTLTDLIAERIVIEAKRELYLTNKAIKQIAYDLGYQDEYYFSRFFKTNADVSPQMYRETVGAGRAEKKETGRA